MARSAFDPTTKKAALFSGLLHLFALLFLVLGVVFSGLFAKEEEPHIFEMVALPNAAQVMEEMTFEPLPVPTVDIPEEEPIELPEPPPPEPEPVQETPPPPQPEPEPQPVIQETPPPPVPVEKPKPEPPPEPKPKPKLISFDQYEKEHGKIEAPDLKEIQKATPKPRPKIDTSKITQRIRDAVSSVPVMAEDVLTSSAAADTDVMKAWRSMLAASLDRLWKQIETKGTAGKGVRVSFYISPGGAISSVKVISSSGIPQLDSLGIQTVQRLGSFQPPPSGSGETVTVLLKVE